LSKLLYIVIQDNKILNILGSFFIKQGYEVIKFYNPEKALFSLKKNTPQVVIGDQDFKMMSGVRFLKKVEEFSPLCVSILLMRNTDLDVAMSVVNEGIARKIIPSPWTSEDILKAVEEGFSIHKLQQENRRIQPGIMEEKKELERWNDLLKDSVKKRTRIILQKKIRLEKLNRKLESNIQESIKVLFSYLDRKNRWIGEHSKKVAAFSFELASELKLPKTEIGKIEIAALLHDIGKIGIPDKIVSQRFNLLSKAQLEEIKEHPLTGQKIISPIFALEEVGIMIRHHHEYWNGRGYPDGLKEAEIPVGSRVIAIANVFANLIEKTYYRAKDPAIRSLKDLVSKIGNELDPNMVDLFINMIEEKRNTRTQKKEEVKIHLNELQENMMLSRDIRTTRGTVVLRKGTLLNANQIEFLHEFDRFEKLFSEVCVYVNADNDESVEYDWFDEEF